MSFPGTFEMAPGADRDADPETYTWTGLTARTQTSAPSVKRGAAATAGFTEPSQMVMPLSAAELANQTDSLVAYQARSQWWPYIDSGLVCRYYLNTGPRWLRLDGTAGCRYATADKATLDIVGDLYVAVQYRSPIVFPSASAGTMQVVGKHNGSGNQRSWLHELSSYGHPALFWSTTGADFPFLVGDLPLPRPDVGDLSLGMYLDVNNGAGGHTLYLWAYRGTIPEMNAALTAGEQRWRLGDPQVGVGVTSIFSSTAPLEVGDISNSSGSPYAGGINALEVRAGNWTGTVAANPVFTTAAVGTGSVVDTAPTPNTWAAAGTAAISNRQVRFLGELAGNQLTLPGHGLAGTARVNWTLQGLLHRLRQGDPPLNSPLFDRIMAPENASLVDAYFPMEDERNATAFYTPIPGARAITMLSGFTFAEDADLPASKALATVAPSTPWGFDVAIPTSTSGDWEVTWLVKITEPGATAAIMVVGATGTARRWVVSVNTTQIIVVAEESDGTGLELSVTSWDADLEYTSIVTLEATQNGGNVDWNLRWIPLKGPRAGTQFVSSGSFAATAGRVNRLANLATSPPSGLTMGHLTLTSGAGVGWLAGADQAYRGEAGAARAFRLGRQYGHRILVDGAYAQTGINGNAYVDNMLAGEVPCGPQPISTLVGALEDAAQATGALVGEATETLALTWRSAWTMKNQTARFTSTATVPPFGPTADTRDLVNDSTVTRPDAGSGRFIDTDHQATAGPFADTRTRNVANDHDLDGLASQVVHESTVKEMRLEALTVELGKDTALVDTWVSTRLGDLWTATDLPAALPEPEVEQLLAGFTETVTAPGSWQLTLTGRPATPHTVHVLDDPTTGKMDNDYSTLNASFVAGTATSLAVAVTSGGWTTDAAEFPFYLSVGGAQITATACGAPAAGVQTFTVSATVANGVTKTVPAGTSVRLWRPGVLAP